MRTSLIFLLLVANLAFAGTAARQREPTPSPDRARGELPRPSPEPVRPAPRTCDVIEADARVLLEHAQQCTETCEVVSFRALLGESCIAAFQCAAALPDDVDLDAFVMAARMLDEEMRACGECAIAACRPFDELDARCVEGQCDLSPRPARPEPRLPIGP